MSILVMEDNDEKFGAISLCVIAAIGENAPIIRATTFGQATKLIYERRFDILIIDLMLPDWEGHAPTDKTSDILPIISTSDLNTGAAAIVLTQFAELADSSRRTFADAGIAVVAYDGANGRWKDALAKALRRAGTERSVDFLIFTALEKERSGFKATGATLSDFQNIRGMDCQAIALGAHRGLIIKLPRMGVVDAAATGGRALEFFRPKLVAMSGICAGVGDEAPIGAIIVASMCWEYQAGKWSNNDFKIEHYDIPVDANMGTDLSQLLANDDWHRTAKHDLDEPNLAEFKGHLGPMGSGSAVIADKSRLDAIALQHRKLSAIDMEMYGIYRSAELASIKPLFFGAKVVVDRADSKKGDEYHQYGCILSARFVADAVNKILSR